MRTLKCLRAHSRSRLAAIVLLAPSLAFGAPELRQSLEISAPYSPLYKVAEQALQASEQAKRDFAWIALVEMVSAHETAIQRANRSRFKDLDEKHKMLRWRAAMYQEVARLRGHVQALDSGAAVDVTVQGPRSVLVFVAGDPIVISDPEMGAVSQLERNIAEHYCLLHLCPGPVMEPPSLPAGRTETQTPAPTPLEQAPGHWSFGQNLQARYETEDGLIFEFRDLADRRSAESACRGLVADLRSLARRLREVQETGFRIDWEKLRLQPLDAGGEQWIILNDYGDFVRLRAPHLGAAKGVLHEAGPWLRSLADGTPTRQVIRLSERFVRPAPQK